MRFMRSNNKKSFAARLVLLAAIFVTIMSTALNVNVGAATYSNGQAYTDKPDVRLSRNDMNPVKANEEFILTLKLDNVSPAYSVSRGKLTVHPSDGLTLMEQSNIFFIDGKGIPVHGSTTVPIKLKAADKLLSDNISVSVSFEFTYWGSDGMASGSENYSINVPAKKSGESSDAGAPVMQIVRAKMDPVKAKGEYELELKIKNSNKKVAAKNVKITMSAGAGFSLTTRASNKFVSSISNDEPYILPVKIKTNKTIEAESLELNVNLSYTYDQNGNTAQASDSEKIIIPSVPDSKADEEGGGFTPNIIIDSYNYGEKVEAGSTFNLKLGFKNTSKSTVVENIVLSINTGEGISVASSSNSFYFEKLGAGSVQPLEVQLKAWEEANSAAAVLTINFTYEYRSAKNVIKGSASESISIPVVQPDRFELSDFTTPSDIFVNEEAYISIPYVNKGKATTSNINAIVEGEGFECLSRQIWVGNAASGMSGSIDIILTPYQEGDLVAKVKVEYEDANSEKKEYTVELPFYAQPQIINTPMEEPDVSTDTGSDNPLIKILIIAGISVAVLAALIVVIVLLSKRASAKRRERLSKMYDWAMTPAENGDTKEEKIASLNKEASENNDEAKLL